MIDIWRWPVVGGDVRLSVVLGEVQGSDAHALRGGGPAVDLPGHYGQALQPLTAPVDNIEWFYDPDQAGHYCDIVWLGTRGVWQARYCHQTGPQTWEVGTSGNTQGPHLHLILWLDGERVRPEDQPEFQLMLGLITQEEPMRRTPEQQSLIDRQRGYAAELDGLADVCRSRAAELETEVYRLRSQADRLDQIASEQRQDAERLEVEEWPEVP